MEDIKQSLSYKRAKKRVGEIKAFYFNLMAYCIVIPTLITINLMTNPGYYWFLFSTIGWGIGLTVHGLTAFDKIPFFNSEWENRKMHELIEKEKQKQQALKRFQ